MEAWLLSLSGMVGINIHRCMLRMVLWMVGVGWVGLGDMIHENSDAFSWCYRLLGLEVADKEIGQSAFQWQ